MRTLEIVGHPVSIMSMFLLILISGEAFGGPYFIYLVLGLPNGADYSISGFIGMICLFVSYKTSLNKRNQRIKSAFALAGIFALLYSLYIFFAYDRMRYNYNTFEQSVPLITLIIFGLCILCGIFINTYELFSSFKDDSPINT